MKGHSMKETTHDKLMAALKQLVMRAGEFASNPIVTCEKCEGSGEQWGAHQEACHTCGGVGRVCQDLPEVQDVEDLRIAISAAQEALEPS